ncbi:MAG: TerB N-terminal domain-containing protein [Chloroflexota bacterium]
MNSHQALGKFSNNPPLTLRMMLVHEGIKIGIYEAERVLSHAELTSSDIINRLPPPLTQFLHSYKNTQEHVYLLAWPDAKYLYENVKPYASDRFLLQCEAVKWITVIERPANFAIQWIYNPAQKCLERRLLNADQHLGKGWFQRDRYVWQLDKTVSGIALKWISLYQIPDRDVFRFVSEFIPISQRAKWPVFCSLSILTDFAIRLEISQAIDRSIEVQIVSYVAGVVEKLGYLEDDSKNMISGDLLLPSLRPVMTDKLIQLAHAHLPVHITGSDLPAFIQDEIRPHATQLGIDMQSIDREYPIADGSRLPFAWKLEHKIIQGVGQHIAIPYLGNVPLCLVASEVEKGERFIADEKGWIEFTPVFRTQLDAWTTNGIGEFQITVRELLGLPSARLERANIQLPTIVLPADANTAEHAGNFLDKLRFYGLPGGFSGAQADANSILVDQCQRLLKHYPDAKILWIVTYKKRAAVAAALQQAHISYVSAETAVNINKQVVLLSPGASVELTKSWTLIILQDLDVLALSDAQVHFYSQLNRLWTLATFIKENWYDDQLHVPSILRALQLVPENLQVFQQTCVQHYPEQIAGVPPKLTTSFKEVIAAEATSEVRIPPRVPPLPTWPNPMPITRSETVYSPVRIAWEPTKETFIAQAHRYANRVEPKTDPIPFTQYWPTYEVMTPAQQNWYFYWRSQVRQGNYLPADLSYLLLHVYEVIHVVGFVSPQIAFDYLVNLWHHYRSEQPKLDSHLVDWLADFLAFYRLPLTPLAWYNQARQVGATAGDFDLYVEAWTQTDGRFTDLASPFFYRLADYSPTKTKFYQEHNRDIDLDAAYKKGVQAIDDYARRDGTSLISMYRPIEIHSIVREPFAGALHELDRKRIFIAKASPWSKTRALSFPLSSTIKYTENILRKQAKFKSQLQGIELPKEWEPILDQTFAKPLRKIEINTSMVWVLKQESEEVRKRLIVEENPSAQSKVLSANTPLSDLEEITTIMGNHDSITSRLLHVLREHNWTANETILKPIMEPSHILNSELDYLNQRTMRELGNDLICKENGLFIVAEDYRDEIAYVLDHPVPSQDTVSSPVVVVPSGKYTDLTVEWAKLAQQMKVYHWDVLVVLLAKVDINARLDAIARSIYSTTSGLIDDINMFALDSIGDIVISTEGTVPYIEAEDMEGIQMLLAWAYSKALLEK